MRERIFARKTTFQKLVLVGGLVFFVLLGAFLLTGHYISRTAEKAMRQAELGLMEQAEGKFEDYHHTVMQVATAMAYSPTVYSYFFQDSLERVISNEELSMVFSNTFLLEPAIMDIFLYDKEMGRIAGAGKEAEELESLGFLKEWKEQAAYSGLFAMPDTGESCYALFFPVFDLESEKYAEQIGMCVLVMKAQKLAEILADTHHVPGRALYLADADGQMLASAGSEGASAVSGESVKALQETTGTGEPFRDWSQEIRPLAFEGWVLALQRQGEGLPQEAARNIGFLAAAYLLAALLVLWLLIICYRSLVRPIQEMDDFVQKASSDPGLRIFVKDRNEIGKVEQGLNRMLDSIAQKNAEIQEVKEWAYQAELAKKQLQILVYRNQINPHFLYNTLDCIRAMAVLEGQKHIAAITMALSRMFRFAVKEENVVAVEEEVSYIREYARIIDYRFGGKISVQIAMEEAAAVKPILKLILQPLIENAVFHGLERKVGGGVVNASVRLADTGRLRLEVTDNGCGMSKEALAGLRKSLAGETEGGGIGLPNIARRLKLFYGDGMELSIDSKEQEGTRVVIEIADQVADGGIAYVSDISGR